MEELKSLVVVVEEASWFFIIEERERDMEREREDHKECLGLEKNGKHLKWKVK